MPVERDPRGPRALPRPQPRHGRRGRRPSSPSSPNRTTWSGSGSASSGTGRRTRAPVGMAYLAAPTHHPAPCPARRPTTRSAAATGSPRGPGSSARAGRSASASGSGPTSSTTASSSPSSTAGTGTGSSSWPGRRSRSRPEGLAVGEGSPVRVTLKDARNRTVGRGGGPMHLDRAVVAVEVDRRAAEREPDGALCAADVELTELGLKVVSAPLLVLPYAELDRARVGQRTGPSRATSSPSRAGSRGAGPASSARPRAGRGRRPRADGRGRRPARRAGRLVPGPGHGRPRSKRSGPRRSGSTAGTSPRRPSSTPRRRGAGSRAGQPPYVYDRPHLVFRVRLAGLEAGVGTARRRRLGRPLPRQRRRACRWPVLRDHARRRDHPGGHARRGGGAPAKTGSPPATSSSRTSRPPTTRATSTPRPPSPEPVTEVLARPAPTARSRTNTAVQTEEWDVAFFEAHDPTPPTAETPRWTFQTRAIASDPEQGRDKWLYVFVANLHADGRVDRTSLKYEGHYGEDGALTLVNHEPDPGETLSPQVGLDVRPATVPVPGKRLPLAFQVDGSAAGGASNVAPPPAGARSTSRSSPTSNSRPPGSTPTSGRAPTPTSPSAPSSSTRRRSRPRATRAGRPSGTVRRPPTPGHGRGTAGSRPRGPAPARSRRPSSSTTSTSPPSSSPRSRPPSPGSTPTTSRSPRRRSTPPSPGPS